MGPPFLVRTHWRHGRPEVCDPSSRTSNQHRLDCAQVPCSVVLLLLCFDFVLLSKLLIPCRSVLWFSKPIVQRTHQHVTSCCIFTVFSAKTENFFFTKLILSWFLQTSTSPYLPKHSERRNASSFRYTPLLNDDFAQQVLDAERIGSLATDLATDLAVDA